MLTLTPCVACADRPANLPTSRPTTRPAAYGLAVPHVVRTGEASWKDKARDRVVPVNIYAPDAAKLPGPLPVVILSHGLGGSKDANLIYLAKHLAASGYIAVTVTHAGSDTEVGLKGGREGLLKALVDPDNLLNRPADISFVIDRMTAKDQDHPLLKGRVDAQRIGVAGHSFGAYTALAVGGETIELPGKGTVSFLDKRVKAVVAMSPQKPGNIGLTKASWDKMVPPTMTMTGTRDIGLGVLDPTVRRFAFDHMPAGDKYHVVIREAGHMSFSDSPEFLRPTQEDLDRHELMHKWIGQLAAAFFDRYLRDDEAAGQWLKEGAIEGVSKGDVGLERK